MIMRSPLAARLMHLLVARIGDHNAVVVSQRTLADLLQCSERGVRDAVALLRRDLWLEVRQVGNRGTVNAYVINDRVAWTDARQNLRLSLFSAAVIIDARDQPDEPELGEQAELRRLPTIYPGEAQLPGGAGLPPPSEPALPGMDPDLPAVARDERTGEPRSIGDLVAKFSDGND